MGMVGYSEAEDPSPDKPNEFKVGCSITSEDMHMEPNDSLEEIQSRIFGIKRFLRFAFEGSKKS